MCIPQTHHYLAILSAACSSVFLAKFYKLQFFSGTALTKTCVCEWVFNTSNSFRKKPHIHFLACISKIINYKHIYENVAYAKSLYCACDLFMHLFITLCSFHGLRSYSGYSLVLLLTEMISLVSLLWLEIAVCFLSLTTAAAQLAHLDKYWTWILSLFIPQNRVGRHL